MKESNREEGNEWKEKYKEKKMPSMRLCETEMVQNEDECVEGF